MDRKISEKEVSKILAKMKIKDGLFYGLILPYAKMLYSYQEYDGNVIKQLPEFVCSLTIKKETLKKYYAKAGEEEEEEEEKNEKNACKHKENNHNIKSNQKIKFLI